MKPNPDEQNVAADSNDEDDGPTMAEQIWGISIKWSPVFKVTILLCIALISILIRVFSVIRTHF
jgi:hypothetical protein